MWLKHLFVGVAVLIIGLGVRFAMVRTAEPPLSAADLARFEETYGLDLPTWYESTPFFLLWSRGDGQAFVALASDLDLSGPARELAVPVYRFSRAGYAWLGRLAALGRPGWVPVGLMMVNALALLAVGAMASVMAQRRGPVSYMLAANPALYVGFASDTAEPLGIALLTAALVASTGRERRSRGRLAGSSETQPGDCPPRTRAEPGCPSRVIYSRCFGRALRRQRRPGR